ncbi:MAG: uracil-DNA glycosylase [Muribaculaceae bacterium]|nr:uracil-DNA glycosylase [Muribaculaceae bacterium]
MEIRLEPQWKHQLDAVWQSPQFAELAGFVRKEYATKQIFPPARLIFAAMDICPFDAVKVVIIGQDPYHGPGQANGLCFSVNPGVAMPPSLVNIFKEVHDDIGVPVPENGDLTRWARQGVLLLNSSLTVEAHKPASHSGAGWEMVTDTAIARLNSERSGLVFMLWGAHACRKAKLIDSQRHLVLTSVHPSPLSAYRGFFGCRHFSRANDYLLKQGKEPIKW